MVSEIKNRLRKLGNKERAKVSRRYFKTGPDEYGEGDIFLGIPVPVLRKLAKTYRHLTLKDTTKLLRSPIHEERLLALLILIHIFSAGDESMKKEIFDLYLNNTRYINNWDLVDVSAQYIVGAYLVHKNKKVLYCLARSEDLWERRIAIMSTFHFIRQDEFSETLKIAEILIADREDLIHKAVGWMLREVGKRNLQFEEQFLKLYYKKMPRTMLRYAIEKFPQARRRLYLKGKI
ncbi:MAG: DNA alkylation repair protein [Desulfobacterales bacterium]|jgi:3-methyladenine DNA glycosylase AlkD